jgi:pimeloyl-ACP methyl ester carboxylesterase
MKPWLTVIAAGSALLAAISAVGGTADLHLQPCELRGSQGFGRIQAYCGRLPVPADRARPDAGSLDLFVARVPALKPNPAADALALINGGPGASAVDLYVDMPGAFAAVLLERDILLVDQRGTGRSAPLTCALDEQPPPELDLARVAAATRRCLATLSADPRPFTTSVAVEDLEAVRRALGYPQLNLYGVSYGTRVAQHYLRRYPASVRSLVLDGVTPPDQALGPDIAGNAQAALDRLFARCQADPHCSARFPDPAAQLARLAARLRSAAVTLALPDPLTGRPEETLFSHAHLVGTLRMLSYAPETAALIPLVVDEAEARANFLPLALQARRVERELGAALNVAMHNTVVCSEDAPFYGDLAAIQAALTDTYLGADQVRMLATICAVWPTGPIDPDLRLPLRSDAPVLLLSGELDPVTPPAYAVRAQTQLSNSRHLIAAGQGHGVIARGCLPDLLRDFVHHADPGAIDATCLQRLRPDAFFLDLLGPTP